MDISVTEFKAHCLDLIRKVENGGRAVTIRRRGRIVARLEPAGGGAPGGSPWEQLRALGGHTRVAPGQSSLTDRDFEALR
jgi:antitoxin (DNA-binding transcriptional repressor) of toxin-antitoxin stability system